MASGYKDGSFCELLEAEIDKHGLDHVLIALECICGEKAGHIKVHWQDAKTARLWSTLSNRIGKMAREASEMLP